MWCFVWFVLGFVLGLLFCWWRQRPQKKGRMTPLSKPSTRT